MLCRFYTDDDINKIMEAVKVPLDKKRTVKLKEALEGCAADFFVESFRQKQLTASKTARQLDIACSAAKRLRRSLTRDVRAKMFRIAVRDLSRKHSRPDTQDIQEALRRSTELAIEVVEWIKHHACRAEAEQEARKKVKTDMARHTGDKALHDFIENLSKLWEKTWGASTGEVGEPFIRFVLACHDSLKRHNPTLKKLTPAAVRAHWRRGRGGRTA